MTRQRLRVIRWFYPGLGIKRWLLVALVGVVLVVNGVSRWLTEEGTSFNINETLDSLVSDFMSPSLLAWIFMILRPAVRRLWNPSMVVLDRARGDARR